MGAIFAYLCFFFFCLLADERGVSGGVHVHSGLQPTGPHRRAGKKSGIFVQFFLCFDAMDLLFVHSFFGFSCTGGGEHGRYCQRKQTENQCADVHFQVC